MRLAFPFLAGKRLLKCVHARRTIFFNANGTNAVRAHAIRLLPGNKYKLRKTTDEKRRPFQLQCFDMFMMEKHAPGGYK